MLRLVAVYVNCISLYLARLIWFNWRVFIGIVSSAKSESTLFCQFFRVNQISILLRSINSKMAKTRSMITSKITQDKKKVFVKKQTNREFQINLIRLSIGMYFFGVNNVH